MMAEMQAATIVDTTGAASSVNGTDSAELFLIGEAGHTIAGGSGSDTYVDAASAGGSTIINDGSYSSGDSVILVDANPADVTLSRSGDSENVTLSFAGGGSITIQGQFGSVAGSGMETVQLADGTTWTAAEIKQMLLDQELAASSGSVYGYEGSDDTLVAGLGGKLLSGLGGSDTYVYAQGDGNVTINDASYSSGDKLVLSDIDASDVTLSRDGDSQDVTLSFVGGGSVTLVGQFGSVAGAGLETVQFANGSTWTAAEIRQSIARPGIGGVFRQHLRLRGKRRYPGGRGGADLGPGDFARVHPGDILVCPYTDPGWTPLLRIAAGVVTETGGVLSHAAIVARELRIPAVLGIPNATTRIPDATTITVDGATGIVTTSDPKNWGSNHGNSAPLPRPARYG